MLLSQGWTPGAYLGANDAPHASLHTKANASHLRVMLKDDNLGLGAQRGSAISEGQCVGLDVFQSVLGRLNGKSETDVEKEQISREAVRTAIYTESRWGSLRFVSGGFLVGDKIQDLEGKRVQDLHSSNTVLLVNPEPAKSEEFEKPRDESMDQISTNAFVGDSSEKKRKRAKKSTQKTTATQPNVGLLSSMDEAQITVPSPAEKEPVVPTLSAVTDSIHASQSDKAQRRAEKAERKLEKRLRREAKDVLIEKEESGALNTSSAETPPHHQAPDAAGGTAIEQAVTEPKHHLPKMHAAFSVRQRYIRNKRMAMMDSKALNEVGQVFRFEEPLADGCFYDRF